MSGELSILQEENTFLKKKLDSVDLWISNQCRYEMNEMQL